MLRSSLNIIGPNGKIPKNSMYFVGKSPKNNTEIIRKSPKKFTKTK